MPAEMIYQEFVLDKQEAFKTFESGKVNFGAVRDRIVAGLKLKGYKVIASFDGY